MRLSTDNLTLRPDAAIDLQTHTHFSDGKWTPEALLTYVKAENFGLIAITDHDSVVSAIEIQKLAIKMQMPVLIAVEMTGTWRGELTDLLCYGFNPEKTYLKALAADILQRQQENTRKIFENLQKQNITFEQDDINAIVANPSSAHLHAIFDLLENSQYAGDDNPAGKLIGEAGYKWATHDIAEIVAAAHADDAVCLLAHPGRDDGFICYDTALMDELRETVPIDGLEVYYPRHTPEQIEAFKQYAEQHDLLMSAGSDSHDDRKQLPIKYPAQYCEKLLARLGIEIT